ncbi:CHAT domain-containing protein [Microcoleus sp. F6_B4]
MSRVAVLRIGVGDISEGFHVSLQFWSDYGPPTEEICGRLPGNLKVRAFYELWRSAYRTLKPFVPNSMRSKNDNSVSEIGQTTNRASSEGVSACRRLARSLEAEMKHWLKSGGTWQPIREGLLKKLSNKRGKIRIILQINNPDPVLWKLPWHVWDLLQHDDGSDLEIALSSSEFQRAKLVKKPVIRKGNVRILGVLGDSTGIDVQTDREEVERLSSADATFLDRPQTQDLLKQLRSEIGWDIFLFSGHSERVAENGRIYINQNSSLEVLDFRSSLREAISQGLKIAIFNSCDSVGLVQDLAREGLYIPVAIAMREQVPDAIAQAFLKEFLTEYASGQSLQTSVRRSRDRLEAWEQVWPGVTWLPVICQNPAEVPPTWQELSGNSINKYFTNKFNFNSGLINFGFSSKLWLIAIVIFMIVITGIIVLEQKRIAIQPENKINSSKLSDNAAQSWQFYEETTEGIRIKYPLDWQLQKIQDGFSGEIARFIRTQENNLTQQQLILNVETLQQPITLEAYENSVIKQIKRSNEQVNILESKRTILDKREGYLIVYTYKEGASTFQRMEVGVLNWQKVYILIYQAEMNQYQHFLPIVKVMINSFEIIESKR